MDFSIITLVLNILLILFIVGGFLFGLRGVKKSITSFITFIVVMFIVFLISPAITNLLLKIKISGMTIKEHISSAVISAIGEDIAQQSFVSDIVNNIPKMIGNILTTFILLIVVGLLCKLIVAIICKVAFKKDKNKEIEKCEIVNGSPQMIKVQIKEKKHRLAGGIVGAFKGLLVCLALFMPIVGFGNVLADISGVNSVSAETNQGTELKPINELIKEDLPKELLDCVNAVNNSFLSKVGRIGNIGESSLNIVAQCNINGQTVKLGQEIKSICATYDKFVEFTRSSNSEYTNIEDIFADMMENPENYNFEILDELLDELFTSNIVNSTSNDVLMFAISSIEKNANENTREYLKCLKTAIENYSASNNNSLKSDIKAFFDVFEISAKSGLLNVFQSDEFKFSDISNILLNDPNSELNIPKNKVLNELCVAITKSTLLQKVAIESANYGINQLEKLLNENLTFKNNTIVSLNKINSNSDLEISETELANLLEATCKTIKYIELIDFNNVGENALNIFDYEIDMAVKNAGILLQSVADMDIFKKSGAYISLCDAMSLSEINEYVNFNSLKNTSNIKYQFNNLSLAVTEFKNSGIIATIKEINDDNLNEKLNVIVNQLSQLVDNRTCASRIIVPLLECQVSDNAVKMSLTIFDDYLENIIMNLNPNQEDFAEINLNVVETQTGKYELAQLFEQTVNFANDLQVFTLSEDKIIDEIIKNKSKSFGQLLDTYKNSALFGLNADNESAYIDFISALQSTELNNVFYFESAKDESFSWEENMNNLKMLVDNLNSIEIDGMGLVDYMIDNGDYSTVIDCLNKDNAVYLKPIFECSLLYPIAINVINEINTTIADFVGEKYAEQIDMLDLNNVINLSSQSQDIVNIIAEAIDINISSLDFDNLTSEQISQINVLLSTMEKNAEDGGVFKQSCNALLLKMATIIVDEIKDLVGEELGSSINEQLSSTTVIAGDSKQLISLLNCLLENINSLENSDIININGTTLTTVLDAFYDSKEILNGYFTTPFNALLTHVVNEINGEIISIVGKNFRENIGYYDGTENIISEYEFIKILIASGLPLLSSEMDIDVIDIDSLQLLLKSLRKCYCTIESYNSLLSYISNEIIVNINTLINSNNANLTSTQLNISKQESEIMEILKSLQDAKLIIENKGAKLATYNNGEKVVLTKMLNAFQNNGNKSTGLFRNSYISLINFVATENGITSDIIFENFATDNVIDWESFINQINQG